MLRDGGDDGCERRDGAEAVLPRDLASESIEVDVERGVGLVQGDEVGSDLGGGTEEAFLFGGGEE